MGLEKVVAIRRIISQVSLYTAVKITYADGIDNAIKGFEQNNVPRDKTKKIVDVYLNELQKVSENEKAFNLPTDEDVNQIGINAQQELMNINKRREYYNLHYSRIEASLKKHGFLQKTMD